jgi:hypothetical protein
MKNQMNKKQSLEIARFYKVLYKFLTIQYPIGWKIHDRFDPYFGLHSTRLNDMIGGPVWDEFLEEETLPAHRFQDVFERLNPMEEWGVIFSVMINISYSQARNDLDSSKG